MEQPIFTQDQMKRKVLIRRFHAMLNRLGATIHEIPTEDLEKLATMDTAADQLALYNSYLVMSLVIATPKPSVVKHAVVYRPFECYNFPDSQGENDQCDLPRDEGVLDFGPDLPSTPREGAFPALI